MPNKIYKVYLVRHAMTTISTAPLFPSRIFGIFSKEIKKIQS